MTATGAPPLAAPFRGLAPFGDTELDALLFFGRERETEIAVANLLASRLTILYGPSGVGKSSLLRAGVGRRVRELGGRRAIGRGPDCTAIVFASWADDPVRALAEAIADDVTALVKRPVARPAPGASLADVVEHWTAVLDGNLYLILDQFEEYFVYHEGGGAGALEAELPEVVLRPGLGVNVLLSLRDDALAQLDVFKSGLPNLFANYLRLDRLDRAAATAAIRGPIERWNGLVPGDERVEIEPRLVDEVLLQASATGEPDSVEPPYLQLVLERLWNEERERGSRVLRASTLAELGGAGEIVREHLDRALSVLDPGERDAAARMFDHLVTPSGTKVAHRAADLAQFARVPEADAQRMLATLGRERILRPLDDSGDRGDRYEIFHDVLGAAIVGWRRRYQLEQERERSRRRQRRLAAVALASLAAVLVMVGITAYALSQRSHARRATRTAVAATQRAEEALQVSREKTRQIRLEKDQVDRANRTAQKRLVEANDAKAQLGRELDRETALSTSLKSTAASLRASRDDLTRKNNQLTAANQKVQHSLGVARAATDRAKTAGRREHRQTLVAQSQTRIANARRQLALAEANYFVDPAKSVADALEAAPVLPNDTLPVLRAGLVRLHLRHVVGSARQPIRTVAVSPDGATFAAASGASGAALFDVRTGALLRDLASTGRVTAIAFSPDGTTLAGAETVGPTILWSTHTGAVLHTLRTTRAVSSVAFSPDGRLVATGGLDQAAKVWDAATGVLLDRFPQPFAVRSVSFSPDSRELLTTESDRFARLYRLDGTAAPIVLNQGGTVTAARFSPDGSLVATGGLNKTATIWDAHSGALVHTFAGHSSNVLAVAFSHDGTMLATASADETARIWSLQTLSLLTTVSGHTGAIKSIAFSPDDQFVVTGSTDRTARVSETSDGFGRVALLGHTGGVTQVAYAGPDTVVTTSVDGTARLWDPHDQPVLRAVGRHEAKAVSVAFALGGTRIVSASADGTAAIWPIGKGTRRLLQHHGPVLGVIVGADGRTVLTWSADGTAALWAASTGTRLASLEHGSPVSAAALSPDGSLVATAGGGVVKVWAAATGSLVRTMSQAGADAVAFSPDGSLLATGGTDRMARIWRTADGGTVAELAHPATISAVAFAPDGTSLATSAGNDAFAWSVASWSRRYDFASTNSVTSLAWTADGGRLLVASADGTVSLWNARDGRRVEQLLGHVAIVSQAALSADDRWIVTAGPTTAGVWSASPDPLLPNDRLYFLHGDGTRLLGVAFSPAGWRVATVDAGGSVRTYDCVLCGGLKQLAPLARRRLASLR